jgi:hypothetical protein
MATKYTNVVYSKALQKIFQLWIFGLKIYHFAIVPELVGTYAARTSTEPASGGIRSHDFQYLQAERPRRWQKDFFSLLKELVTHKLTMVREGLPYR